MTGSEPLPDACRRGSEGSAMGDQVPPGAVSGTLVVTGAGHSVSPTIREVVCPFHAPAEYVLF
jgi:hypothetical protein